jgi:hypothetical protein
VCRVFCRFPCVCVCLGLTQLIQCREYRFAVKVSTCNNLPSKKWSVMHMHVQLKLDETGDSCHKSILLNIGVTTVLFVLISDRWLGKATHTKHQHLDFCYVEWRVQLV